MQILKPLLRTLICSGLIFSLTTHTNAAYPPPTQTNEQVYHRVKTILESKELPQRLIDANSYLYELSTKDISKETYPNFALATTLKVITALIYVTYNSTDYIVPDIEKKYQLLYNIVIKDLCDAEKMPKLQKSNPRLYNNCLVVGLPLHYAKVIFTFNDAEFKDNPNYDPTANQRSHLLTGLSLGYLPKIERIRADILLECGRNQNLYELYDIPRGCTTGYPVLSLDPTTNKQMANILKLYIDILKSEYITESYYYNPKFLTNQAK